MRSWFGLTNGQYVKELRPRNEYGREEEVSKRDRNVQVQSGLTVLGGPHRDNHGSVQGNPTREEQERTTTILYE